MSEKRIFGVVAAMAGAVLAIPMTVSPVGSASAAVTTLYVNNATGAGCSDSGSGTQAQPYCTITAAAAAVQPGQTVLIYPGSGYNEEVDITRSGLSGEPITFAGYKAPPSSGENYSVEVGDLNDTGIPYAVKISGAQHVVVQGLTLSGTDGDLRVENSSDVLVQRNDTLSVFTDVAQFQVAGTSSNVTLDRNSLYPAYHRGIEIDAGASGTVVTGNVVPSAQNNAITATDAPGTVITGNTIESDCATGVVLAGASTGSTIENNVIETADDSGSVPAACPAGSSDTALTVSSGSTSGTKVAYNVYDPKSGGVPYSWAGTGYSTVSAFTTASGQGSHDLVADPMVVQGGGSPVIGSPVVDSADASAPGETSADINGTPRLDDPSVSNTGTGVGYYDRGAYEVAFFGSRYTPVTPVRVLDTRQAIGVSTTTAVAPGATVTLPLAGTHGIPTDTMNLGVALNVTVTNTKSAGYLAVYPAVTGQPSGGYPVSQLNWSTGQTIASLTTTPILESGVKFTNHSSGTVNIIADLQGYYDMDGASTFQSLSPARLLDTRHAIGVSTTTAVPAGGVVKLQVTGRGGVPSSNVKAVLLNVTGTQPTAGTYVTVYPDGAALPTASDLNLAAGQTLPNEVVVPVGSGGKVDLYNHSGSVHLIADVQGYYSSTADIAKQTLHPVTGAKILDTRDGTGTGGSKQPIGPGATLTFDTSNAFPFGYGQKVTAVVLNVTVTQGSASSFLTVFPHGVSLPSASNLNWVAGQNVSNQVVVPVGSDGKISFYNKSGSVHVIAYLAGYFGIDG